MKFDEFKAFVENYFLGKEFEKHEDVYYKRGDEVMIASAVEEVEDIDNPCCKVNLYYYLCELSPGYAPVSEHLLSYSMVVKDRWFQYQKLESTVYIRYEQFDEEKLMEYFDESYAEYVEAHLIGGKKNLFRHFGGYTVNPLKGKKTVRDALLVSDNFTDKNHFLEYCGKKLTGRGYKKKRKMLYYAYSRGVLSTFGFSSVYGGYCYAWSCHYIGNYSEIKRSLPDDSEMVMGRGYNVPQFDNCNMADVDKFFDKTFSDFLTPLLEEGVDWLLRDRNYRRFSPYNDLTLDQVEEILKRYKEEN